MKKLPPFPDVPADEQTPCVVALLGLIEKLRETIQQQEEAIGHLKDEIAILKGEKARPKIKPSRMEPTAGKESKSAAAGEAADDANAGRRVPAWGTTGVGGWAFRSQAESGAAVLAPSWPHDAAAVEGDAERVWD